MPRRRIISLKRAKSKETYNYKTIRRVSLRLPRIRKSTKQKKYMSRGGWVHNRAKLRFDGRSFRGMRNIFDEPSEAEYDVYPTQGTLDAQKRLVLEELTRQEELGKTKAGSALEKAFYIVTGEAHLFFDYDLMKKLVKDAIVNNHLPKEDRDSWSTMDGDYYRIDINGREKCTRHHLRIALMHECLHGTVERRGRRGSPIISTEKEHIAMALLGDESEYQDLEKWSSKKVNKFVSPKRVKNAGQTMSEEWWMNTTTVTKLVIIIVMLTYKDQPEWFSAVGITWLK